jgi:hypothetical protein
MTETTKTCRLPSESTLKSVANLAIVHDKPVLFDYWTDSIEKIAFIGTNNEKEKHLVKNSKEYTSTIVKLFKTKSELIVITENSIYVVDGSLESRLISF